MFFLRRLFRRRLVRDLDLVEILVVIDVIVNVIEYVLDLDLFVVELVVFEIELCFEYIVRIDVVVLFCLLLVFVSEGQVLFLVEGVLQFVLDRFTDHAVGFLDTGQAVVVEVGELALEVVF